MTKFKITVVVKEQGHPDTDNVIRYLKKWYSQVAGKHVGFETLSVEIEEVKNS